MGSIGSVPPQGDAEQCLSSLDTYAYWSEHEDGLERCPRRVGFERLNLDTGERRPLRCMANYCPFCGPQNAWLAGGAMGAAEPERMGTLTLVGDDWQTIRDRVKRIACDVRGEVGRFEWVWSVEWNPKGTGHHLHFWQHGAFVNQRFLGAVAESRGCGGVVWIERFEKRAEVISYGIKLEGIRYGTKSTRENYESVRRFLSINGGRLVHPSRSFFRTRSRNGLWRSSTQRDAMRSFLVGKHPDAVEGRWRVVATRESAQP